MFELKTFTSSDKYIRFNQNSIKDFLGSKSFKLLLENGLFKTKMIREYNATLDIQRLVGCLYSDITSMEMHHINKDKSDNHFTNIVPLESEVNKHIDSLPLNELIEFGKQKHKEWEQRINKKKRDTVANNPYLIIDILSNSINKTAVAIHKLFRKEIKSIKTIRNILNTYFYKEDFLQYLQRNKISIFDS